MLRRDRTAAAEMEAAAAVAAAVGAAAVVEVEGVEVAADAVSSVQSILLA